VIDSFVRYASRALRQRYGMMTQDMFNALTFVLSLGYYAGACTWVEFRAAAKLLESGSIASEWVYSRF
jgi:hypothetical protein